jgi:uncharacterized protein (DUF952 family)
MSPAAERSSLGPSGSGRVYKICPRADWGGACACGELTPSADDARDGYVHLSAPAQVRGTLDRHFAGQSGLMLLTIEISRLPEGALRWEPSRGGQLFPHLYGAFQIELVSESLELTRDAEGRMQLPPGL